MGSTLSLLIPPPTRGSNLSGGDRKYLQTLQRRLPLETVDTSAGSYAENAPPAGVNSQSGETNQNQEITYIKTSADANVWTLKGVAGGPYSLSAQLSFLKIKSDGTNWYVSAKSAAAPAAPLVLRTNGVLNGSQTLQNLVAGANIVLTDDGVGDITIAAAAPSPATVIPLVDSGAGAIGVSLLYARQDHVHPASGGGAGSLAGTATAFSGLNGGIGNKTLDVSTVVVPSLDWFIPFPNGPSTSGEIKGAIKQGTTLSGLLNKEYNEQAGVTGITGGISTTVNSDAIDSANGAYVASGNGRAINPASGVAANLGIGFRIAAFVSSLAIRTLDLYIFAWPGAAAGAPTQTVTVTAFLDDGSAATLTLSFNSTATNGNMDVWKVSLQFQGAANTKLEVKVEVTQQSSGSSTVGLMAAVLS